MSSKVTPLQQLANEIQELIALDRVNAFSVNSILIRIGQLLPAEREFASECFEAGQQRSDYMLSDDLYATICPDFEKYYSKFNTQEK